MIRGTRSRRGRGGVPLRRELPLDRGECDLGWAVAGRQEANAVFMENTDSPKMQKAAFGLNMTLRMESEASPAQFIQDLIRSFESETLDRINKLLK